MRLFFISKPTKNKRNPKSYQQPIAPWSTFHAQQALIEDVQDLEKEIQLPPPFLYQGQYVIECILAHDAQKYDAYWYHPDHLGSSNYITNLAGTISQHLEYLPFGETLVEEHLNSHNSPYRFNAKELDEETGWYYYGARYYNPKWSIWLSVDPLAEEMPSWSPYSFSFNNPVKYVDILGLAPFDVIVNGDNADKFVEQLDSSSSLTITRNEETGKLSATGEAENRADRKLLKAINDEEITVNINATTENMTEEGFLFGGAFEGSEINEDGTVTANQTVNPDHAEVLEDIAGADAGVVAMHETLEAYFGAKKSPGANTPTNGPTKAYLKAHRKANRVDKRVRVIQNSVGRRLDMCVTEIG